jgi:hypothetical protein
MFSVYPPFPGPSVLRRIYSGPSILYIGEAGKTPGGGVYTEQRPGYTSGLRPYTGVDFFIQICPAGRLGGNMDIQDGGQFIYTGPEGALLVKEA